MECPVFTLAANATVSFNLTAYTRLEFSSFWGFMIAICTHTSVTEIVVTACVQSSTNGTNGIPISFKVLPMALPMVPLVCHRYQW